MNKPDYSSVPFRHWIWDDAFPAIANDHIPTADKPGWEVHYSNPDEVNKRTTRHLLIVPGAVSLYERYTSPRSIFEISSKLGYAVIPDPDLYCGGVQVIEPGGELNKHIDADLHADLPMWRRAATLILYLGSVWTEADGGHLLLCRTNGEIMTKIEPKPSRAVMFENSDVSYHGVEKTNRLRASLMIPFLKRSRPHNVRTRANFLPRR